MREPEHIVELFDKLQEGDCWAGVNMQQALQGVTAEMALKRYADSNCIWQLVNHLVYWRKRVMKRLIGDDTDPDMPDFFLPESKDEASWQNTLVMFRDNYTKFRAAILRFDAGLLYEPSPKKGQTYYDVLMGCLQHDAYHMGQMVLLKKRDSASV
jgi:uncharacterized damage-inducible protein DinB